MAGPHKIAVTFRKKTSALIETERQPYLAHFNADRHPRIAAGALFGGCDSGLTMRAVRAIRPAAGGFLFVIRRTRREERAARSRFFRHLMRRA